MSLFRIFGASSPPERDEGKAGEAAKDNRTSLLPAAGDAHEAPRFDNVAVLEAAGVGVEQRQRVERTLELLRGLPTETPASVRKGIVAASLKAFDISIKAIVEAAVAELTAYDAFTRSGHKQLDDLTRTGRERIAQLQGEVEKIEKRLAVANSDQAVLDRAAFVASERVRPVLSFFSDNPVKVANDTRDSHPPSIIIDESLTRAG